MQPIAHMAAAILSKIGFFNCFDRAKNMPKYRIAAINPSLNWFAAIRLSNSSPPLAKVAAPIPGKNRYCHDLSSNVGGK